MITKFVRNCCVVSGVAALCAPAWGALPDVLNRVAPETAITLVIPSLDRLDEGVSSVIGALELPMMSTPKQMMAMAGLREGVDFTRAAALVIHSDDFENEAEPHMFLLVPTNDFEALVAQFGPVVENGVHSFDIMGDMTYAKNLGNGYAVAGPVAAEVAAFNGEGSAAAFEKAIGKAGAAVAERSDAYAIVQVSAFKDLIREGLAEARADMEQGMGMMAQMGGQDPEQMAEQLEMGFAMVEGFVEQSQAVVIGADASAMGVSFEMSSNFAPGSEWAGLLQGGGASASLISKLPAGPYLLAYAADFENPLMQHLFKLFGEMNMNFGGMPGMEGLNPGALMEHTDGQALAVYPSAAGIMGGVFSGMVAYTKSGNPDALRTGWVAAMNAMGEVEAGEGEFAMTMQASLTENAGTIGNTSYDAWSMTFNMGGQANPFMGQMFMMLFGQPDGIKGLMATTADGMYMTYSSNPARLQDALDGGASLADDQMLKQVSERLPGGRIGEFYLGVDSILAQVMPFVQMQMGPMDLGIEGPLPPMGMGMTARDGSMHGAMFVPMPLIKTGAKIGMTIQQMQMMQQGGDGNPPF